MSDNDKTEISARVRWFWVGYALPANPDRAMAFALGESPSMLAAAKFALDNIDWLRTPEVKHDRTFYHSEGSHVTDRGLWCACVSAASVLDRATRELDDILPHIVPLRTGNGVMYATGAHPDVWEWEELLRLAFRPVVLAVECEQ